MRHIHRFFVKQEIDTGQSATLASEDAFHATRVLRLKPGVRVELADPGGRVYAGEVLEVGERVLVKAVELLAGAGLESGLTVAQAIPRGRRMDLVVEKLSELGVDRLVPVWTDNSVSPPEAGGEKMGRWRRLARAAAAQSKRDSVMTVEEPSGLSGWAAGARGLIVLATENDPPPLGGVLDGLEPPLSLVIGPEAGFSQAELSGLESCGAAFGSLGGLVLRTETAALVAATIVLHHMGRLG